MKNNFMNLEKIKFEDSIPNDTTIVTFFDDKPLSFFNDNIWDFKDYITSYVQNTVIDFDKNLTLKEESKFYIKLCLYYYMYYETKDAASLSYKTILEKYKTLRQLAKLCESFNVNFSTMNNHKFCFNAIVDSISSDDFMFISKIFSILCLINNTGYFFNFHDFGVSNENMQKIKKIRNLATKKPNQTLLIPSKILAEFIYKSSEFFQNFSKIKSDLFELIKSNDFTSRRPSGGMRTPFNKLTMSESLRKYFAKYSIEQRPQLISHFLYIQALGSAHIACFSGMRKGELCNLPYTCFEIIENKIDRSKVYLLNGCTNKKSRIGLVSTSWVTSKKLINVIESLKFIAQLHKALIDIDYIKEEIKNISLNEYPLFPIFNQQKHPVGEHPLYLYPTLSTPNLCDQIYKIIQPIVFERSDLMELSNFNLLIDWEDEYGLEVNKNWNFSYHQFRRSLAVYCCRSNIVKLPALKKQFKHISFDMTLYYTKNYHNALNISLDQNFISSYQKEIELFKFSSFSEKVIENDSILFGVKGTHYEILKNSEKMPKFFSDRNITKKYVKENRLSYRKTPLGGCGITGECKKLAFAYVTACVTCNEAIFDDDSVIALNKAKANYQRQLLKFDKYSISYKQFEIEINAIDNVLAKRELLENRNV